MKRALITGSEGFAGGHLWKELEKQGYEVFGTTLKEPDKGLSKNLFICDITTKENIKEIVNDLLPDYIFHLAAQAAPSIAFKYPRLTIEVNTIGSINLLDSVREIPDYRPRILFVGSSEEYGVVSSEEIPVTEDHPLNPISPYSVSKIAAYHLSKIYNRAFDTDVVYACSFNNTGPGQATGFLAPDVAAQIVNIENGKDKPIIFTGNLDTFRDYTDVRDVVRAYVLLLEKGKTGERYNICSGDAIATKEIVETLIKLSTVKIKHKVDPSRVRPSDIPVIEGSFQKIHELTGWQPSIPLKTTLKDLLDSYRNRD